MICFENTRTSRFSSTARIWRMTANTPSLEEDEEGQNGLEPISSENIISGGRRTRGKNIDFQEAAEKTKDDEMDDDDDDEDFAPQDNNNNDNNDDDQMRD